jgi:hypothetical protein
MPSRISTCFALSTLLVLAACQAITDETKPEQESVAEIENYSSELERAAEESVNRQIADSVADAPPLDQ